MLRRLKVQNFKCLVDQTVEFGALTLLTGVNGAGKSSVLHALLLLRQAEESLPSEPYVKLNGRYLLALGQAADVLSHQASSEDVLVSMAVESHDGDGAWSFRAKPTDRVLTFSRQHKKPLPALTRRPFTYLHAERHGPRQALSLNSLPIEDHHVGNQGEFVAQVLALNEHKQVRPELLHSEPAASDLFRLQVEAWMQALVPGLQVRARTEPDFGVSSLWWKRSGIQADWVRSTNMGFGASYALPIVVAGLLAPKDSLFLVENPEAHLHPLGQSAMGRFLARLAVAGVQVICETHSDHVLNGIRLATVAEQHALSYRDVRILYFSLDERGISTSTPLTLNRHADLSDWPTGFFDQSEQDLKALWHARTRAAETAQKLRKRHGR